MSFTDSADSLRAALPQLAAEARARGAEFEAARRIAPDFADKLKRVGLARLLVPRSSGGLGASLPDWFEVMMELAEADASTGWVCAHGSICGGLIHASAEPAFRDEFFGDAMAYASWSNLPRVQVEERDDGLLISGSWSFESGCTLATHVGGMVLLPARVAGAPPRPTVALVPVVQARIFETWDPIGLGGTGSHDVHFEHVFVPRYRTFAWPAEAPVSDYPAAIFVPGTWFIANGAAATHLGLARRALDEARKELLGKQDRYTQKLVLANPALQRSLEAAEGLWQACRAGMRESLRTVWASALRGEPLPAQLRVEARVAAVTAVQQSAAIVRVAYDSTGASAVRRGGVLERLLREASCLTHHVSSNLGSLELTGRVRCGLEPLSLRI